MGWRGYSLFVILGSELTLIKLWPKQGWCVSYKFTCVSNINQSTTIVPSFQTLILENCTLIFLSTSAALVSTSYEMHQMWSRLLIQQLKNKDPEFVETGNTISCRVFMPNYIIIAELFKTLSTIEFIYFLCI